MRKLIPADSPVDIGRGAGINRSKVILTDKAEDNMVPNRAEHVVLFTESEMERDYETVKEYLRCSKLFYVPDFVFPFVHCVS